MIVNQAIYRPNETPCDGECRTFDTHKPAQMARLARRERLARRFGLAEKVIRSHDLEDWFGERD